MNAQVVGQTFLWGGFLVAAVASVRSLEIEANPWQTVPWSWYLAGVAVAVIGVIMLRVQRRRHRETVSTDRAGIDAMLQWLQQAADLVARLRDNLDAKTCEDVLDYIDHQCVPVLVEISDHRMIVAHRLGYKVFAAMMTEFASGERYLNRAWSAAADGYVDEVERCVRIASDFFADAASILAAAIAAEKLDRIASN